MQMGVANAEVMMNIGLCCFECQQYDFALSSIKKFVYSLMASILINTYIYIYISISYDFVLKL